MSNSPPARISIRLGTPLTLGTASLAAASLVQSGLDLRWISTGQTLYVGIMMLTLPLALPLIACVVAYVSRDAPTGTAAGVISTTWASLGVVQIVSGSHTSAALGLLLVASGVLLGVSGLTVSLAKPLPGAVFMLAALRFTLTGVYHLSSDRTVQYTSGIVGLVVVVAAVYTLLAFELQAQGDPLLPMSSR